MEKAIGIIGGYSAIGSYCAKEISSLTMLQVYIAGRDPVKAAREASSLPNATGMQLDIYHEKELDEFCKKCSIVINCAGPSTVILDRIALAALKHNCHYIDIGGYDVLYDLLKDKQEEILLKKLSFLISAGWIPGASGVFPIYISQLAENKGYKIKSLEIFISGKEEWSYGSCRDMVWAMFEDFSGIYRNGNWVRKAMFTHTKKIRIPARGKKYMAFPLFNNQLKNFAIEKKYPLLAEYVGAEEFNWLTQLRIMYIKIFMKHKKEKAAEMLQRAINRDMKHDTPRGIVYVRVKDHQHRKIEGSLFTLNNKQLTGTVPGIAAGMLLNGTISRHGLSYLCEAVNVREMMRQLKTKGFDFMISADPLPDTSKENQSILPNTI